MEVYGVSVALLGGVDDGVECWDSSLVGVDDGVACGTTAGDCAALETHTLFWKINTILRKYMACNLFKEEHHLSLIDFDQ